MSPSRDGIDVLTGRSGIAVAESGGIGVTETARQDTDGVDLCTHFTPSLGRGS
jgi:hypothetical protein